MHYVDKPTSITAEGVTIGREKGVAFECELTDRTKYRDIILPMTVIRRLDAVLEPTRAAVLARKAELDAAGIPSRGASMASAKNHSDPLMAWKTPRSD
jgi:hypothetical protein